MKGIGAVVLTAGMVVGSGATTAHAATFDWLAGHWCGGDEDRKIEEVWLAQAGGALLGMSRTVSGGAGESFEFMRLVPTGKSAGLHVQPNGVAATVFSIIGRGDGWVVFEHPSHDFPNRIEYRREGASLRASIQGPDKEGKLMVIPFDYRRCDEARRHSVFLSPNESAHR